MHECVCVCMHVCVCVGGLRDTSLWVYADTGQVLCIFILDSSY